MSTSAAINRSAGGDSNPLFENKCQLHPQYIYHVMNFFPLILEKVIKELEKHSSSKI